MHTCDKPYTYATRMPHTVGAVRVHTIRAARVQTAFTVQALLVQLSPSKCEILKCSTRVAYVCAMRVLPATLIAFL